MASPHLSKHNSIQPSINEAGSEEEKDMSNEDSLLSSSSSESMTSSDYKEDEEEGKSVFNQSNASSKINKERASLIEETLL